MGEVWKRVQVGDSTVLAKATNHGIEVMTDDEYWWDCDDARKWDKQIKHVHKWLKSDKDNIMQPFVGTHIRYTAYRRWAALNNVPDDELIWPPKTMYRKEYGWTTPIGNSNIYEHSLFEDTLSLVEMCEVLYESDRLRDFCSDLVYFEGGRSFMLDTM